MENLDRREFLFLPAAVAAVGGVSSAPAAAAPAAAVKDPFVGIHIAPHSLLDEGIDYCLDLLKDQAAVTAPMLSPYAYYGAMMRPLFAMGDHGVPKKDNSKRRLPVIWVRHNEKYFNDTSLRHATPDKTVEYADRDVLMELAEPLRKRGMKLYIRIYEPGGQNAARFIGNWSEAVEVGVDDRPLAKPCLNNPEFRAWTAATVEDLFANYPLDGIQYGAERCGPLGNMLVAGGLASCFCEHCLARGRSKGIDSQRAKQGFTELQEYLHALRKGAAAGPDGALIGFLRILVMYPEILAWERQWHLANGEVHKLIRDAVKRIRPNAEVGRHVSHIESSFDPFYRAAGPYGEMAEHADFVKIIIYHEIFGARLLHYLEMVRGTALKELAPQQALDLFYAIAGHDPKQQPTLEKLNDGMGSEYVYREVKRCADSLAAKAKTYAGIGLDIPKGSGWGTEPLTSDPGRLYKAVRRSFDAGAAGIVISREYEENQLTSLKTVGRAVRDVAAGK